jgi:hypothetical protein
MKPAATENRLATGGFVKQALLLLNLLYEW